MVLERVEIACLGAEAERDLRHLAGRALVIRGQLAALFRLAVAAAAGRQHDGAGLDLVLAAACAPASRCLLEIDERRLGERLRSGAFDDPAQRLRDRVAGAVSDLEQPLPRRAAAARASR